MKDLNDEYLVAIVGSEWYYKALKSCPGPRPLQIRHCGHESAVTFQPQGSQKDFNFSAYESQ